MAFTLIMEGCRFNAYRKELLTKGFIKVNVKDVDNFVEDCDFVVKKGKIDNGSQILSIDPELQKILIEPVVEYFFVYQGTKIGSIKRTSADFYDKVSDFYMNLTVNVDIYAVHSNNLTRLATYIRYE